MGGTALKKHVVTVKHLAFAFAANSTPSFALLRQNPSNLTTIPSSSQTVVSPVTVCESTNNETEPPSHSSSVISSNHSVCNTVSTNKIQLDVLDRYVTSDKTSEAEILWCINAVMCHMSCRTAGSSVKLFSRMFLDSQIAQ